MSVSRSACCLVIMMLFFMPLSASNNMPYPDDVISVLDSAGTNRSELEKVLEHYAGSDDTLMYQAACYLIGNMEGHCYATYALKDSLENVYELDVSVYLEFESLLAYLDSLESRHGELEFQRKDLLYDIDSIRGDFLINHIDYAFRAWRQRPWAKRLSYDQFREYILPYRGSNEPLEEWRPYFWDKYDTLESVMSDPSDPIEAASLINNDIMSWFKFDRRYYMHPTDQGLTEMLEKKMGRCEDMTNLTIFAMRANGLAVTSDYTPFWANAGNNHAWNAILGADGKVIPFMGAESNPGEYNLRYKLAKVYRKMYGLQKENLIFQDRKQEKIAGWLAGKSYIDVTADYIDVGDVSVTIESEIPDSVDIAYICVFNDGDWRAINWGRINSRAVLFQDMGTDVVYLPSFYINKDINPCGSPFILHDDMHMEKLTADTSRRITVSLTGTTRIKQDTSTDGVDKIGLIAGKEYELFYWDNGWLSLGKKTADDQPLLFDNVPANALYWLVADDSDKEERIFTYSNDCQIWW